MFRSVSIAATALLVILLAACGSSTDSVDVNTGNNGGNPDDGGAKPYLVEKPLAPGERGVSDAPEDPTEDYVFTWDLMAGQNTLAGTVEVALSTEDVCVTYNMNAGWEISGAHLYVGLTPPDPNGAPGQFPYMESFDPPVATWTYCVPLEDLGEIAGCCENIYVATHAYANEETIWGGDWNDGDPTYEYEWANKWGGYFDTYLLPNPSLPTDPVWYNGTRATSNCYWLIDFEDADPHFFPAGDWTVSPAGNTWNGWCFDKYHLMFAGLSYQVTLYSSLDNSIPAFGQNPNWDKVNYMLTQKNNPTAAPWIGVDWSITANKNSFQYALWHYSDGFETINTLANELIDDADANGDNFLPLCGDYYAVVLFPDTSTEDQEIRAQMNIVEVQCNGEEE